MINQLKKDIEIRFGKKIAYQKDCKLLSNNILETTSDYLSIATLRRFFGFLVTNSNPSSVTLDILSRYVGYDSWNQYVTNSKTKKTDDTTLESWVKLQEKAKKISTESVNKIISKPGIDFPLRVPRQSVNEILDSFVDSDRAATAIIGPGGYGKSTILAKWYQNKTRKTKRNKEIILYTTFRQLEKQANQKIISDEFSGKIDNLLGYSKGESIMETLVSHKGKDLPQLIIVIDEFELLTFRTAKLDNLFISICEFLKTIQNNRHVRLILAMRYSTWKHFETYIESKENWFNTNKESFNHCNANIPALKQQEIQQVLDNTLNHKYGLRVHSDELEKPLQDLLSYPYFLQLYTEIFKPEDDFLLNDHISLTREFLRKQIEQSPFSEEKTDIILKIMELSDFGRNSNGAKKNDLKSFYPIHLKNAGSYFSAYEELLNFGILNEVKEEPNYGGLINYIRITNNQVFNQLIIEYYIQKNGILTFQLFRDLEKKFQDHQLLAPLIILAYQLAYKEKSLESLKAFFSLKTKTILSVFNNPAFPIVWRNDDSLRKILIPEYAKNSLAKQLIFTKNPDINYLVKSFGNNIRYCIEKSVFDENEIKSANILLAYEGILRLDPTIINNYIAKIRDYGFSQDFDPAVVGRWYACMNLYESLINGNTTNKYVNNAIEIITSKKYSDGRFEDAFLPSVILLNQLNFSDKLTKCFESNIDPQATNTLIVFKLFNDIISERKLDEQQIEKIDHVIPRLNPLNNIHIKITGLVIKASYFLGNQNLNKAYENFRNAIELSNYYEYTLVEVKLLKVLASNLRKFGEVKKANDCQIIINDIELKSGIKTERL